MRVPINSTVAASRQSAAVICPKKCSALTRRRYNSHILSKLGNTERS
jgi:hypothetical protein